MSTNSIISKIYNLGFNLSIHEAGKIRKILKSAEVPVDFLEREMSINEKDDPEEFQRFMAYVPQGFATLTNGQTIRITYGTTPSGIQKITLSPATSKKKLLNNLSPSEDKKAEIVVETSFDVDEDILKDRLSNLLAFLRAQYWLYQTLHWQANDYQLHLVFQRIYDAVFEEVDSIAERVIGLTNKDSVEPNQSIGKSKDLISKWTQIESPVEQAIQAEEDFLNFLQETITILEKAGRYTLGLEDLLPSFASQHEEHMYLLKQSR